MALGALVEHLQRRMDAASLRLDGVKGVLHAVAVEDLVVHGLHALVPELADHVVLPGAPHAHRATPEKPVNTCESEAWESTL